MQTIIQTPLAALGLAAVLLTSSAAHATLYVYPYNAMTAEEVVDKLLVKPVSERDFQERDRAYHYVEGIKDGTQGLVWCFQAGIKPDELIYQAVHAMKRHAAPGALKQNAAPLLLQELRRRYPCAPARDGRA